MSFEPFVSKNSKKTLDKIKKAVILSKYSILNLILLILGYKLLNIFLSILDYRLLNKFLLKLLSGNEGGPGNGNRRFQVRMLIINLVPCRKATGRPVWMQATQTGLNPFRDGEKK